MAYDVALAERLREILAGGSDVVEKPMFGGLAFLVAGDLTVTASSRGGLLLRVDPARADALLADPRASRAVMRGQEMTGWLRVDIEAEDAAELERWVREGVSYVRTLPPQ